MGQDLAQSAPKLLVLKALVDTGATTTYIVPSIAKRLELDPIGFTETATGAGVMSTPYYMFRIGFLNDANNTSEMLIPEKILEGPELAEENHNFDILLGMDVLSQGIFQMTGRKFTFKVK